MEVVLIMFLIGSWIWSVARGIQVSFLCAALNFIFPPASQIVFAIYEEKMRTPLLFMIVSAAILFFTTGETAIEGTITFDE